jgi:hypothetical protein
MAKHAARVLARFGSCRPQKDGEIVPGVQEVGKLLRQGVRRRKLK